MKSIKFKRLDSKLFNLTQYIGLCGNQYLTFYSGIFDISIKKEWEKFSPSLKIHFEIENMEV